jgi:hypothetical protein
MYLNIFPRTYHRWQWWNSTGERDALSHKEDFLARGCLGKRRKPLLR